MSEQSTPAPENPTGHTGLKKGSIKKAAAGMPGVFHSMKHVFGEAGVGRGFKALLNLNKKGGFDCPSCAWPDPDDERSTHEYCENGAKAIAEEATVKKLTATFFEKHSVNELSAFSDHEIGRKGRIAEPLYLPQGGTHYHAITWDDAFKKIANSLNGLSSPDEAIFYTSGRTSNEAAFLYQLFVREYGTNNLPDCSNMCHESSGVALSESLGIGKGSVKLEDLYEAEVIMILGQNPGTNHPRMLTALQKAKVNGAKIVAINPLPEAGLMGFNNPQQLKGMLGITTALTDLFLQVKINGDMALLQAIEKLLIEEDHQLSGAVLDHPFIETNTTGFNELKTHLCELKLEDLTAACGISERQIRQTAEMLKDKKKIIVCWAMGLTQHKNAVDTIKEIVNLLLMKGSIGIRGGGTLPVRGHSNVQGDRTMGIYEKPSPAFLDALENNFHFVAPKNDGYDTVQSIRAMHEGKAKVFIAMGGNFLSATPDTTFTAEAIMKCDLTVHVSTKLNRSHLVHGKEALILPCLGRSDQDVQNGKEQFVSCENSMGVVQSSKGVLKPVADKLLSESVIVCRLALATIGNRSKVDWKKYMDDYDMIRDDIERTIPGFNDYNQRVRTPGGFYLPNSNREGKFNTPTSKARFNIAKVSMPALQDDELLMMTIRSHDQFNTTIYGLNDRYRGIYNERRVVLMNQNDMNMASLNDGDIVNLLNFTDGIRRIARNFIVVKYPIPENCCATYFPEANVLVPLSGVADKSNTPCSKQVIVKIEKSEQVM
jgi:molybdopterin-dependent oxidoreductase alpha subunit